jgi:hypothetical protein
MTKLQHSHHAISRIRADSDGSKDFICLGVGKSDQLLGPDTDTDAGSDAT